MNASTALLVINSFKNAVPEHDMHLDAVVDENQVTLITNCVSVIIPLDDIGVISYTKHSSGFYRLYFDLAYGRTVYASSIGVISIL